MSKAETGKIQIYLEPDMKMNHEKEPPAEGSPKTPASKTKKTKL